MWRESFKSYLPDELLYRRKEAFSDGVSSLQRSWYEIIQEFSTEQATMEPKQFNTFLTAHLIKNAGLSEELAKRETAAMIAGKRRVQENDYAYVVNDDYQNVYYVFYL